MKKFFLTWGLFFTIFFISIFTSLIAQDSLTLYQTRLCIMFKPGVVILPNGTNQAKIQDIPNLPNWLSSLSSAGLQDIAKAIPNFDPADTIKTLPNGKKIKKLNYSNIYRLIFASGSNLDSILTHLDNQQAVIFVERWPVGELTAIPNDSLFSGQWALRNTGDSGGTPGADISATGAWNYSTGSNPIKIGIIDTGVRGTHEDLIGKVSGETQDTDIGHGTGVAAVAAATGNNQKGIAGVNWGALIYSRDIGDSNIDATDVYISVVAAVDTGCQVLNNSWAVGIHHTEIRSAFAYAYKNNRVAVASMGNSGGVFDTLFPAGFAQGVIAVGATTNQDRRANYSSIGNHIDVAAPGGAGIGVGASRDRILTALATTDASYSGYGGTSFAAPHVSGLASLLLAYNPNLSNDDIQNIIQLTAKDVNAATDSGWDPFIGWGRINAQAAFDSLQIPNTLDSRTEAPPPTSWVALDTVTMTFFDTPCLADGNYSVVKWEVTKDVPFPFGPYYVTPPANHVWGVGVNTDGYSTENPNFAMGFCEVVPGTITPTGCRLRTYVYEVLGGASPPCANFVPTNPNQVSFSYTVLGERELSLAVTNFNVTPLAGPPNRIKSSWRDCNANEEGFRVKRKTVDSTNFTVIASLPPFNPAFCILPADTFSDANIIGSETYTYKLEVWTRHQSLHTTEKTVTSFPREPQNLTATVLTDPSCEEGFGMMGPNELIETEAAPGPNCYINLVDLSWQAPSAAIQKTGNISQYNIHVRRFDGLEEKWVTVPESQTNYRFCLKGNKTYDFWVHTIDIYGAQSLASNKVTKTTGNALIACMIEDPPRKVAIPDDEPNDKTQGTPTEFSLSQNYPNPFNLSTQIKFDLPKDGQVQIEIYNILGQKIKAFDLGYQSTGYKSVFWDGTNQNGEEVSSGLYLYRIKAGEFQETKRMTLLK